MARTPELLESSQRRIKLIRDKFFLELMVTLFVFAYIILAFIDESFRPSLKDLGTIFISGYLGNKVPK